MSRGAASPLPRCRRLKQSHIRLQTRFGSIRAAGDRGDADGRRGLGISSRTRLTAAAGFHFAGVKTRARRTGWEAHGCRPRSPATQQFPACCRHLRTSGKEPTDCAVTTQRQVCFKPHCGSLSREPGRAQVFPGPAVRTRLQTTGPSLRWGLGVTEDPASVVFIRAPWQQGMPVAFSVTSPLTLTCYRTAQPSTHPLCTFSVS